MIKRIKFFFLALCFGLPLYGDLILFGGPELYHISRWREGGTKQKGFMDGARVGVERIEGNAIYLGADFFISQGKLQGETGSGLPLDSLLTDHIVEGRTGFTFQQCREGLPFITLFGGYGYFHETNDFSFPSPIPFTFTDTYNYIVAGFLSGINFTPLLSMGLNFKIRFMMNGKSKVTNDPLFEDVELIMNNETQFRVEVPFTYGVNCPWPSLEFSLVPFYEFRHFGGRQGFPFDYIDTKFSLIGARIACAYRY